MKRNVTSRSTTLTDPTPAGAIPAAPRCLTQLSQVPGLTYAEISLLQRWQTRGIPTREADLFALLCQRHGGLSHAQ